MAPLTRNLLSAVPFILGFPRPPDCIIELHGVKVSSIDHRKISHGSAEETRRGTQSNPETRQSA
jgi:hypothetical protein